MKQCRGIVVAAWLAAMAGSSAAADAYDPQGEPPAQAYESGFYLRGDAGWFWADDAEDGAGTAGLGVGSQWNPLFRTDLRADLYNYVPDWKDGGQAIFSVMANGYFDLPVDSVVKPYLGAGIGYGLTGTKGDNADHGLATALMGGITFDASEHVAVDIGYRFRTIATDGGIFADDNVHDHAVTAGLRFQFYAAGSDSCRLLAGQTGDVR
jgi:opacity protein-like surface antigen